MPFHQVSVHYGKYFITVQLPFLQQKNSVFGFQNLQMKALPARREQTARRLLATTFV